MSPPLPEREPASIPSNAKHRTTARSNGRHWLTRTIFAIGMASLFSDLSHETITTVLPAFLATLGAAAGVLGTVEGLADGMSTIAKLYGGWLADRLTRRKPLCAAGYGVMALSPLVIAAATSWSVVLAGRVLAWMSRGLRTPPRKSLLADAVSPDAYGRAFGFERAMDTCGAILAPLAVLGLLAAGVSQQRLILLSALPAGVAVAAIWMVHESPHRTPVSRPLIASLRGLNPSFKEFLAAVGLFGLGDFADTLYILYAGSVLTPQIGAAHAGTLAVAFYVVHNVLYAGWSYVGGWIADRVNKRSLLIWGYVCAAAATLCMVLNVDSYAGLVLMFALAGTGVGIYEAVEDAIAADLLPRDVRGSGYGALAVTTGLGDTISSVMVGWLWAGFGIRTAASAALVLMLAGTGLMFHLRRRPKAAA